MDELERELRQDAERIRVEVTPALRARIDASLRAAGRSGVPARRTGHYFWWASGLTGVAAALLLAVLAGNRGQPVPEPAPVNVAGGESPAVDLGSLRIEHADFTEPLEDELDKLRTDLERARDEVEREIRFTF